MASNRPNMHYIKVLIKTISAKAVGSLAMIYKALQRQIVLTSSYCESLDR